MPGGLERPVVGPNILRYERTPTILLDSHRCRQPDGVSARAVRHRRWAPTEAGGDDERMVGNDAWSRSSAPGFWRAGGFTRVQHRLIGARAHAGGVPCQSDRSVGPDAPPWNGPRSDEPCRLWSAL